MPAVTEEDDSSSIDSSEALNFQRILWDIEEWSSYGWDDYINWQLSLKHPTDAFFRSADPDDYWSDYSNQSFD